MLRGIAAVVVRFHHLAEVSKHLPIRKEHHISAGLATNSKDLNHMPAASCSVLVALIFHDPQVWHEGMLQLGDRLQTKQDRLQHV